MTYRNKMIARKYDQGLSITDLALIYGITTETVRAILKEAGEFVPDHCEQKGTGYRGENYPISICSKCGEEGAMPNSYWCVACRAEAWRKANGMAPVVRGKHMTSDRTVKIATSGGLGGALAPSGGRPSQWM